MKRRIIKLTLLFSMCFTFLIFISINTNTYAATGESLSSFMGSTYDEDNFQTVISGTMDNIPNKFVPYASEEANANIQNLNKKSAYMCDSDSDFEGDIEYFDISYIESRIRYLFSSEDYHSSKVFWEGDGNDDGTTANDDDFEDLTFIFSTKFTLAGTDRYLNISMDITSGATYYDGEESTSQFGIRNMYIMLDGTTLVSIIDYNLDYYYCNNWFKILNKAYNTSTIYELITYGREHCIYILSGSTASVLTSNVSKIQNRSSLTNQRLKLNLAECYSGSNLTEYFEDDIEEVQSFTSTYISIFDEIFNSFYTFKAVNLQEPTGHDDIVINTTTSSPLTEEDIIKLFELSDNGSYTTKLYTIGWDDEDNEISYFGNENVPGYYDVELSVRDNDNNLVWYYGTLRVKDEDFPEIKWTTLYIIDIAEGQTLTKVEIKEFLLNSGQLEEE